MISNWPGKWSDTSIRIAEMLDSYQGAKAIEYVTYLDCSI